MGKTIAHYTVGKKLGEVMPSDTGMVPQLGRIHGFTASWWPVDAVTRRLTNAKRPALGEEGGSV